MYTEITLDEAEVERVFEKVRKAKDKAYEGGIIRGVLDDHEKDRIRYEMRSEKAARLRLKKYTERIKNPPQSKKLNSRTLLKMYLKSGLVLDKWNKDIVKNLCRYFSGEQPPMVKNKQGELEPAYSLKKGVYIFGNCGTGKTIILSFFRRNSHNPYVIKPCIDLALEYQKEGADTIIKYDSLIKTSDPGYYYGNTKLGLCFEDLGTEDEKKNFGNLSNVLADLILKRYTNLYDYDGNEVLVAKTHATTNLSMSEIKERYGSRVHSRITEMFNIFAFDASAPDRRRNK